MTNFQRVGAISNAHVGRDFEDIVAAHFASEGLRLGKDHGVPIGLGNRKKMHKFDLGCAEQKVVVECKSHRWTEGGNVPSAKMTVWNEAMYYFLVAPATYRKILAVLRDQRAGDGETLAGYYMRIYDHMVPNEVEIWEFDVDNDRAMCLTR